MPRLNGSPRARSHRDIALERLKARKGARSDPQEAPPELVTSPTQRLKSRRGLRLREKGACRYGTCDGGGWISLTEKVGRPYGMPCMCYENPHMVKKYGLRSDRR